MKKLLIVFLLGIIVVMGVVAQTTATQDITIVIPQIKLIRLLTDTMITLTVGGAAGTPGATPTGDTNDTEPDYLQYTVLNPTGTTQKISVRISSGTVPNGLSLAVAASGGTLGNIKSIGVLTGTAQELIGEIGSGFTGTGSTSGMLLTYTLAVTNATQLVVNAGADIDVEYTIADDA